MIDLAPESAAIYVKGATKTFREGGRQLGIQQLADIGELGERHHDDYVKEANRLVQQMFVEHARGAEHVIVSVTGRQHDVGAS